MSRFKAGLRGACSLLAGLVFGVGLALAQMTNPEKVLDFLDVTGAWDASLLFVLGGAVVLSAVAFRWVLARPAPQLDDRFHLPETTLIDSRLITGAAIFGIGWAIAGYCPGPAVASLGFGNPEALWVLPSVIVGAALQRWLDRQPSTESQIGQNHSLDVFDIKN
jgi:uncharacterized membrane protein YedE/YeeE